MPIHWREDLHKRWAVMVYADPYTRAEWERAMGEILEHARTDRPLRLLVDRRYCRAPSADFVRHIAGYLRAHQPRFVDGSIAIVATDAAGYGVARMTELLLEQQVPCTIRAFREWSPAEEWLAARSDTGVQ